LTTRGVVSGKAVVARACRDPYSSFEVFRSAKLEKRPQQPYRRQAREGGFDKTYFDRQAPEAFRYVFGFLHGKEGLGMRKFFLGLLLGAAAGILYAPNTGARMRSILRDKLNKLTNNTQDILESKSRDINVRVDGVKQNVNKAIEQAKPHVEQAKSAVKDAYGKVKSQVQELREDTEKTVKEIKEQRSA
jgi:gas vesicle protein